MQQEDDSQQNDHQHESQEEEEEEPQHDDAQHNDSQQDEPQEQESQHDPRVTPSTNTPQDRESIILQQLPEECTICLCVYKEQEQRPRALPCGHTFCSLCIANLLRDGHLSCPNCCAHHRAANATHFPVNYDLENMIRRFRSLQTTGLPQNTAEKAKQNGAGGLGRKLQSIIKEQRESMEGLGGPLQEELNQLEQYRVKLSLSLTKHERLLEELDQVTQQHRKAMKLLRKEDLRVEAFMEKGKKNQRGLKAAQDQLDCVTSPHEAYPIVDAADDSAVVVEGWLQHSKEEFPSGTAYSASCKVLENTEAALEVILKDDDINESITSGHPNCTILEMLQNIQEKSAELVRERTLKGKFKKAVEGSRKALEGGPESNFFSIPPKLSSDGDKTPSPCTFNFQFGSFDCGGDSTFPTFEAPTTTSGVFSGFRFQKAHRRTTKNEGQ